MIDKSRWIKIIVGSLILGILIGGGLSLSHHFFPASPEKLLQVGEDTYAKGEAALKAGDGATASLRFEEANLQANKALDAMARERSKAPTVDWSRVEGQGLWLKTRALRDEAFAHALVKGQPFPETTDPVGGLKFRSILYIPDPQTRQNALAFLEQASALLKDDKSLLREALLTETMLPSLNWGQIERIARQSLEIEPNDPWSLYLLARFDFDQPSANGRANPTAPAKKRSRERVLQARQYVERLKSTPSYPLWRTLFLEAEIVQWLRDDAEQSNAARREAEEETLRTLLFGPKGALARSASGEGLEHPAKWDAEGVLGLHEIALKMAVRDSLQPEGKPVKVVELLEATLDLCRKLADRVPMLVSECALAAIGAMNAAEPVLAIDPPPSWNKCLQSVQDLAAKAKEQKVVLPRLYESLASLLDREAHVEGRRGNAKRRAELDERAVQWIEDGLRLAAEAKTLPVQLAGLNALAAGILTLQGDKKDDVQRHLAALKEAKTPQALALASLYEAVPAAREGRLNEARRLLEKVVASGEGDLVLRANMILGGIYLDLGEPDKALVCLQQVQSAYTVFDKLTPQEKAWALEFVRRPEDLALLMIKGCANSAQAKLREQLRRNPGKPPSMDSIRYQEKAIAELRKSLTKDSSQDRQARESLVAYFAATGRREEAEKEMNELRTLYPNRLDVLRAEVGWIESERDAANLPSTAAVRKADLLIERFIKDHPNDLEARYYRVEWLIAQKRLDDALAYLRSPSAFPDAKSERYQRVLASALLVKGDRQGSQKVLEHLPHDPASDALLIQAAAVGDQEQLVQQALARHKNDAQFQVMQAMLAYNKGAYESAAETFLRASRYSRFEALGRRGLLLSLIAMAQTEPVKARGLAERMHKDSPDEPLLLLAVAYADVLLDDIGPIDDNSRPIKNMASALNAWEQMVLEQSPQNRISAPLTKSAFWALAGRQDLGLNEAVRALNLEPANPAALRQTIVLALELRDPDLNEITRRRLDALKQVQPGDTDVRLLEARFDEETGRPKEAVALYEDALKKDAKLASAYLRLIPLLTKQGDKERARSYVRRWREQLPEDVAAARMEVRLLAENNEIKEARRVAEQFIDQQLEREKKAQAAPRAGEGSETNSKRSLDDVRLGLQLQMILGLREAKAWSEAERWLLELQAKNPDRPAVLSFLGDVYLAEESWAKARAAYEKVWTNDKTQGAVGNNLAWILAEHLNEAPKALSMIAELRQGKFSHKPISGDRLRPEFLDTLGLIYTKAAAPAQYEAMRELFEEGRQRFPRDPRLCLYLGRAYAGLGDSERAERMFAAATELAHKADLPYLTPEKCKKVISEAEAEQKKLKETAKP